MYLYLNSFNLNNGQPAHRYLQRAVCAVLHVKRALNYQQKLYPTIPAVYTAKYLYFNCKQPFQNFIVAIAAGVAIAVSVAVAVG